MVQVVVSCADHFVPGARYVMGLFLEVLGLGYGFGPIAATAEEQDGLIISYGQHSEGDQFPADDAKHARLCIQAAPGQEAPEQVRMLHWQGCQIPLLAWTALDFSGSPVAYFSDPEQPAIVQSADGRRITVAADLVWSAFYLLSRGEEHGPGPRDAFGRFPPEASLAQRYRFIRFPAVDAYIHLLGHLLERIARECHIPLLRKAPWPDGRRWALCLSHDVDWVKKWTVGGTIKYLLGKGQRQVRDDRFWQRLRQAGGDLLAGRDPYENLDDILGLESRQCASSTFFFLPGIPNRRHADRKILGGYPRRFDVRGAAGQILRAGGEVELHGGFDSFHDEEQMAREKTLLYAQTGVMPRGVRQHFLRYSFPQTPRVHQQAGLEYDTTLGFGDHPGYRCGISYPFRLYDLPLDQELAIVEIPLVIMDGGLKIQEGLSAEQAWQMVEEILRWSERFQGACTVLWHNTSFCALDDGGLLREIYRRLLQVAYQGGAWLCSCGHLLRWWRWRQGVAIGPFQRHRRGGGWCLRAPGPAVGRLRIEVTAAGIDDLIVEGCHSRPIQTMEGSEPKMEIELYDWSGDEVRVHLVPGPGCS